MAAHHVAHKLIRTHQRRLFTASRYVSRCFRYGGFT